MAHIEKLTPFIIKWEGGYVNDPLDHGGATNMGVTIHTWKQVGYDKNGDDIIDAHDMKLLTKEDFNMVLRLYWNRWKADEIHNQALANLLVDWVWASGSWGIKIPQYLLGLKNDGVVGPKTLQAVNGQDPEELFTRVWNERAAFLKRIVDRDKVQRRFFAGWMNRLNDFKYYENS